MIFGPFAQASLDAAAHAVCLGAGADLPTSRANRQRGVAWCPDRPEEAPALVLEATCFELSRSWRDDGIEPHLRPRCVRPDLFRALREGNDTVEWRMTASQPGFRAAPPKMIRERIAAQSAKSFGLQAKVTAAGFDIICDPVAAWPGARAQVHMRGALDGKPLLRAYMIVEGQDGMIIDLNLGHLVLRSSWPLSHRPNTPCDAATVDAALSEALALFALALASFGEGPEATDQPSGPVASSASR